MSLPTWLSRLFGRGTAVTVEPEDLPVEGHMPEFTGITAWLNGSPLSTEDLRGKVVLIDFWTYSCVNCIRTLPYVSAWHERYKDKGLVIIGIHSPEFPFEQDLSNVRAQIMRHGIAYPVALDNDYAMWRAYGNRYWPAHYFVDARGRIRYHHFGEGGYAHSEAVIRGLLKEAGQDLGEEAPGVPEVPATDFDRIGTPETYLGYERVEYLGSPETLRMDADQTYSVPPEPAKNIFYLDGSWEVRKDCAVPKGYGARIVYRVRAAKVNLVMDGAGTSARIHVTMDGKEVPDGALGKDLVREGTRAVADVREGRLYGLVDTDDYADRLIEIRFLEPGARVYAFTFG